jgi:cysteine protease ATG4
MFELDTIKNRQTTYDDGSSHSSSDSSHSSHGELHNENNRAIYLLGQRVDDEPTLRHFQKKLYWMTYRRDLQVGLRPYGGGGKFGGVTAGVSPRSQDANLCVSFEAMVDEASCGLRTDAGWGCMLRSAQMMLAQTVRVHFSTSANVTNLYARRGDPLEEVRIATWFADFPNPDLSIDTNNANDESDSITNGQQQSKNELVDNHHWYSLHQMVAAGLGLGVLPGEWYGPTTACHVLRELNELHCAYLESDTSAVQSMFRVCVATEGCVYLDKITKLMTKDQETEQSVTDPLTFDDPLSIPVPTASSRQEWDSALLLLLPLRLGIHSIPIEKYAASLSKLMQFSQSVGMLGGTPRHALWFYGAEDVALTSDGTNAGGWYGLDPHTTQPAPRGELEKIQSPASGTKKQIYRWKVNLNESYLRSLHIGSASHSNHEKAIPLSNLDPTLALGFYFANHDDFASFQTSLHELNSECKKSNLPAIISVTEKSPNYEGDVGEVMKNMALNKEGALEDDLDGFSMKSEEDVLEEDNDDEEDEYVLV